MCCFFSVSVLKQPSTTLGRDPAKVPPKVYYLLRAWYFFRFLPYINLKLPSVYFLLSPQKKKYFHTPSHSPTQVAKVPPSNLFQIDDKGTWKVAAAAAVSRRTLEKKSFDEGNTENRFMLAVSGALSTMCGVDYVPCWPGRGRLVQRAQEQKLFTIIC